ncbi:AtpZ/AtpI family protein [Salibacterium qingdaonense]|uniref:AtpZ/AtpI family protein n=1 Tax=Salibacterium qingdaonense TaxID=266892 RepID=UPI00389AB690
MYDDRGYVRGFTYFGDGCTMVEKDKGRNRLLLNCQKDSAAHPEAPSLFRRSFEPPRMEGNMADKHKSPKPFQSAALTSAVLSYLVGPLLIGIFAGRWLDDKWGTAPFIMIIGLLAGLATGVYGLTRLLEHYLKDGDDRK